jgi:hypothetical protein
LTTLCSHHSHACHCGASPERFPKILQDEWEHQKRHAPAKGRRKRLIKLCQSASAPRVSFEITKREAA